MPGECLESVLLLDVRTSSPSACLKACKDYVHEGTQDFDCNYYTYFFETDVCSALNVSFICI